MKFYFSPRTTTVCLILASFMIGMSLWQASRHRDKISYIEELGERLKRQPEPINQYADSSSTNWDSLIHRRLKIECSYDYRYETILRNRRYEDKPGAFVITPCLINGSSKAVLVNRGFVSFAFMDQENRIKLNRPAQASFTGLVKESMYRKIFSPSDPPAGGSNPWVDAWLRVDIHEMQKQVPFPLLPIYVEIIPDDAPLVVDQRLVQTQSGRDEMLYLGSATEQRIPARETVLDPRYPIAVFDTVIPPGRHLGYIYEWGFMAAMTILTGIILQFRRRPMIAHNATQ